jgi:hypothetical protein
VLTAIITENALALKKKLRRITKYKSHDWVKGKKQSK